MSGISAFKMHAATQEELDLLHGTLNKWCREKNVSISGPAANRAAVQLIDWFQFGIRNPDQLMALIRQ